MNQQPKQTPTQATKIAQLDQLAAVVQSLMMEIAEHLDAIRSLTDELRDAAPAQPPDPARRRADAEVD